MAKAISQHPNLSIPIVVERGGERVVLQVTPANEGGKGKIGVAPQPGKWRTVSLSPKAATIFALETPAEVVENLVVSLGELVTTGKAEGELSGPAGIIDRQPRLPSAAGWS